VSVTPRPLFTPGKDSVPIVQEAGRATGPVWTDAENLAPTGIRFPDRPARSQSLYRLSYPAHFLVYDVLQFGRKVPMLRNVTRHLQGRGEAQCILPKSYCLPTKLHGVTFRKHQSYILLFIILFSFFSLFLYLLRSSYPVLLLLGALAEL